MDSPNVAFFHLKLAQQGKSSMLSAGCDSLAHERVCVPRVVVDHHRLSDLSMLSGVVSEATMDSRPPLRLQSIRAMRAGVAAAVLDYLIHAAARHVYIHASTSAARALAKHELELYHASPGPCGEITLVPPGMTPRQYFLSPRTIEEYRQGTIIGQERDHILGHYPGVRADLVFRRWLQPQIPKHTILVNGKRPTYSIPDALPAPQPRFMRWSQDGTIGMG